MFRKPVYEVLAEELREGLEPAPVRLGRLCLVRGAAGPSPSPPDERKAG